MSKIHSPDHHVWKKQYPLRTVPTVDYYSPIEPAYQTCGPVNVIPMAFGPRSKAIGPCAQMRGDTGQCVGSFLSHHVDARDIPSGCLFEENSVEKAYALTAEDPAGALKHHGGEDPRMRDQRQGMKPCDTWGPCASYGSYSACPNCSLSSGIGNSVLGESAQSWCKTRVKYNHPYPSGIHQPAHNN
jgi:hypothetical protein